MVCGVDIGGTFTDCVLIDENGNITEFRVQLKVTFVLDE